MIGLEPLRELLKPAETMSEAKARAILLDPEASPLLLYLAAKAFYGPEVAGYEPDSLWHLLDVPVMNRDKLLAALTLQVNPSFFWDLRVFGHSCLAFNEQAAHTELVPAPLPEHLAWGCFLGQTLFQIDDETEPEFGDEVAAYVGACLANEGFTYAPGALRFCNEHLFKLLSTAGRRLSAETMKMCAEENPKPDPESALGIQLARFQQIIAYMAMKTSELSAQIKRLTSSDPSQHQHL